MRLSELCWIAANEYLILDYDSDLTPDKNMYFGAHYAFAGAQTDNLPLVDCSHNYRQLLECEESTHCSEYGVPEQLTRANYLLLNEQLLLSEGL